MLSRDGVPVPHAPGYGNGDRAAARVGAVFDALAHHLSGLVGLDVGDIELHRAHEIASGVLAADMAVSILGEGENHDLACTPYQALAGGPDFAVPVFLSMPDYLDAPADPLRTMVGDHYDYTAAGRYSTNSGWAAGSDPVEAGVHALNELVERDAFSLLLVEQFLATSPPPLRLVDPATLPADLADDGPQHLTRPAHLERLLAILTAHGMTALARTQYFSENLAVVNVFVPGLERFMIVTDGQLVVPGARGLDRIARDIRRMP